MSRSRRHSDWLLHGAQWSARFYSWRGGTSWNIIYGNLHSIPVINLGIFIHLKVVDPFAIVVLKCNGGCNCRRSIIELLLKQGSEVLHITLLRCHLVWYGNHLSAPLSLSISASFVFGHLSVCIRILLINWNECCTALKAIAWVKRTQACLRTSSDIDRGACALSLSYQGNWIWLGTVPFAHDLQLLH